MYELEYITQVLSVGSLCAFIVGVIGYHLKINPLHQLVFASIAGFLGSYIYDKLWSEAII